MKYDSTTVSGTEAVNVSPPSKVVSAAENLGVCQSR